VKSIADLQKRLEICQANLKTSHPESALAIGQEVQSVIAILLELLAGLQGILPSSAGKTTSTPAAAK
jgi:hypothetical protein